MQLVTLVGAVAVAMYWPPGHAAHKFGETVTSQYMPALQPSAHSLSTSTPAALLQDTLPVSPHAAVLSFVHAGQAAHAVLPQPAAYVPAGHAMHIALPGLAVFIVVTSLIGCFPRLGADEPAAIVVALTFLSVRPTPAPAVVNCAVVGTYLPGGHWPHCCPPNEFRLWPTN